MQPKVCWATTLKPFDSPNANSTTWPNDSTRKSRGLIPILFQPAHWRQPMAHRSGAKEPKSTTRLPQNLQTREAAPVLRRIRSSNLRISNPHRVIEQAKAGRRGVRNRRMVNLEQTVLSNNKAVHRIRKAASPEIRRIHPARSVRNAAVV